MIRSVLFGSISALIMILYSGREKKDRDYKFVIQTMYLTPSEHKDWKNQHNWDQMRSCSGRNSVDDENHEEISESTQRIERAETESPKLTPRPAKGRRLEGGNDSISCSMCMDKSEIICNLTIDHILSIYPSYEFKKCPGCDHPVRLHRHERKPIEIADELMKLAKLKEQGFLTEEEFQIAKSKFLKF